MLRSIAIPSQSLGGQIRPDPLRVHVCRTCDDAIDSAGSIGPGARERAVLAFLERTSERKAARLRLLLSDAFPPPLPGWRAMPQPRVPNETAWGHLRRLIDRL